MIPVQPPTRQQRRSIMLAAMSQSSASGKPVASLTTRFAPNIDGQSSGGSAFGLYLGDAVWV
ncbi:MAG TPA: hypothetical protein VHI52_18910 [Verrucomicrobiae bacterium]|nr:hypothetical protein [Verrucomicrobiae bacterium]